MSHHVRDSLPEANLVISEMLQVAINNSASDPLNDTLSVMGEDPSHSENIQDPERYASVDGAGYQTSKKSVCIDQALVGWHERLWLCPALSRVLETVFGLLAGVSGFSSCETSYHCSLDALAVNEGMHDINAGGAWAMAYYHMNEFLCDGPAQPSHISPSHGEQPNLTFLVALLDEAGDELQKFVEEAMYGRALGMFYRPILVFKFHAFPLRGISAEELLHWCCALHICHIKYKTPLPVILQATAELLEQAMSNLEVAYILKLLQV
ncbi:hypothetical protein BD769DRAFT_1393340 [Suillus cothurnatus]|nr:hypothetical protein BD769DRAFT_1393340 [Suillus cothurnatus]